RAGARRTSGQPCGTTVPLSGPRVGPQVRVPVRRIVPSRDGRALVATLLQLAGVAATVRNVIRTGVERGTGEHGCLDVEPSGRADPASPRLPHIRGVGLD